MTDVGFRTCQLIAGFVSICLQAEMFDYLSSLGVTCGQLFECLRRCWLSTSGLPLNSVALLRPHDAELVPIQCIKHLFRIKMFLPYNVKKSVIQVTFLLLVFNFESS